MNMVLHAKDNNIRVPYRQLVTWSLLTYYSLFEPKWMYIFTKKLEQVFSEDFLLLLFIKIIFFCYKLY